MNDLLKLRIELDKALTRADQRTEEVERLLKVIREQNQELKATGNAHMLATQRLLEAQTEVERHRALVTDLQAAMRQTLPPGGWELVDLMERHGFEGGA